MKTTTTELTATGNLKKFLYSIANTTFPNGLIEVPGLGFATKERTEDVLALSIESEPGKIYFDFNFDFKTNKISIISGGNINIAYLHLFADQFIEFA